MLPFCRDNAQCTKHLVKSFVYHAPPLRGPTNLRCRHYITYFKHGHRRHLANNSQVDIVLMAGVRGLPYSVGMERINALEGDVMAIHNEGEPTEIPVGIPADPASESATTHASASDSGTESNTESQLQAACKPIPSFTSGVQKSTASRSQAPSETTARINGNIRQASSKSRPAKTLNAGTAGQYAHKYFKTADNDISSREQRAHTFQDRSGQQRDWSGRQQDRIGHQRDWIGCQQERSGQQQDRLARGCTANTRNDVNKEVPEPLAEGNPAVGLFKHKYPMHRTGVDDALREFQDTPVPMPPISCLRRGCEHRLFHSRDEFRKHCDTMHAGYQGLPKPCFNSRALCKGLPCRISPNLNAAQKTTCSIY